ncbi:MAG: acetyl-CoA decarbonylase/synthase complex subunit gamma [Deltaproteobacteria bacterium]
MALSGLDIYKLLPKTNCKQCGFPTCLAFAMQLAKKAVSIEKCPFISPQVKAQLEAASAPPIRQVTIGKEKKVEAGNETVMFRHEEKFRNPCGLGIILEDTLGEAGIKSAVEKIRAAKLERIGQLLEPDIVAIRQKGDAAGFVKAVKACADVKDLVLVLISSDAKALSLALEAAAALRPLIYGATAANAAEVCGLAKKFNVPMVVSAPDLDALSALSTECSGKGVQDLVLDTGKKKISEKLWDLTQIRRLALKKSNRTLGYPVITIADNEDPCAEALEAATYVVKYASIVLVNGLKTWEMLALLTLRQNIYTDPQKPLQIEPKVYSFGKVTEKSPVMVTTNFSLSFYTVAGEVEASKVPSYILSVDTEGQSVLTAWASEKFTPEKVAAAMNKSGLGSMVSHKQIIIPGYVAVMSGDLEEQSGWKVVVGPKEASGIPSFLKNLKS